MLLALGVVSAVLEARTSGQGQVVDAAMVEGSALLATMFHAMRAQGLWNDTPGTNLLDSGAHFYEVYATSDGGHIAVGALEPQFYAELLRLLELDPDAFPQWDQPRWPEFKARFADGLRHPHAGRVGGAAGRPRRRARPRCSALHEAAAAPAQRRARHVRGGRREAAARARAALQPHARGDLTAPG